MTRDSRSPSDPRTAITVVAGEDRAAAETVSIAGARERPIVDDERAASAFELRAKRFEEQGELGRGGMGRVADVFDRSLARNVAVKSLLSNNPASIARFEREARITAQLEHPSIVPLYEAGRHPDGTPYYVMRRVDGKPLDQAVRRASFDERLALVPNLLAVCDAVAYAHARSIIHRDIKPSNILLGRFGETLLIDWGLARQLGTPDDAPRTSPADDALTRSGSVTGTPGFMAPEQARGDELDARADVYALGAALFYVLSGEAPHDSADATALVALVASGEPPRWEHLPAAVPPDLRAILEKTLADSADRRYVDAGALAADLRSFVTGNLVAAHHYSAAERLARFLRRHRVAVAVGTVAAGLLASVITVAMLRIASERDAARAASEREAARADDLILANARRFLDVNPTLAVALVRPLADSPRWHAAADVLAGARARGVAFRLPASERPWRLGMSRTTNRAFSVGTDGRIWLYDLAARSGRVVFVLGRTVDPAHPALVDFVGDTQLAIIENENLTLLDVATGVRQNIALATRPASIAGGVGLYWVDAAHHAWRLDGTEPHQLAIDDEIETVVTSLDGERTAALGKTALWISDRAGNITKLLDERPEIAAWEDSSNDLITIARHTGRIQRVHFAPDPVWGPDNIGRGWPDRIVGSHGHLAMQQRDRLTTDTTTITYGAAEGAGLAVGGDGWIAAAASNGTIDVLDGVYRHRLIAPTARLEVIIASPGSPYLLGSTGSELVAWDLGPVLPQRVEGVEARYGAQLAGPHHLFLPGRTTGTWVDLITRARSPGPALSLRTLITPSPWGAVAVALDADAIASVMQPGVVAAPEIAKAIASARMIDARRVAVAGTDGHVAIHDLGGGAVDVLAPQGARVVKLLAARDHVVVARVDGSFDRYELSTHRSRSLRPPHSVELDQLDEKGRLWMVSGRELSCWELDDHVSTYAMAPSTVVGLYVGDARHVVLDTPSGAYIVDPAHPGLIARTGTLGGVILSGGIYMSSASQSGTLFVQPRPSGGAAVLDAVTGVTWSVGQSGPQTHPAITLDGKVIYDVREGGLVTWPLAFSESRAATVALANALTDAAASPDGDTVIWPDQR